MRLLRPLAALTAAAMFASVLMTAVAAPVISAPAVTTPRVLAAQSVTVSASATVQTVVRDQYEVTQAPVSTPAGLAVGSLDGITWPFPAAVITDTWGPRSCAGCTPFHHGIDFAPADGTPIPVVADGTVTAVVEGTGELGTYVAVAHTIRGQGVQTRYAHMRAGSPTVTVGQTVRTGGILGLVGNTGQSTGPHLHFELQLNGVVVDPMPWLLANATLR